MVVSRKLALSSLLMGFSAPSFAIDVSHQVLPVSATGHDRFYDVAFDAAGNFYAVGSVADSTDANADYKTLIVKFLADGSVDHSFGADGYAIHNLAVGTNAEVARGIVVDSQGRVLVGGQMEAANASDARDRDVFALRLNSDGSLDNSFGVNGVVTLDFSLGEEVGTSFVADGFGGMAIDANDQLFIEGAMKRTNGTDTDFVIAKLSVDGELDSSFGNAGIYSLDIRNLSASAKKPILLPNGGLVGTGYSREGTQVFPVVFKMTADGMLDTSFGENGIFTQNVTGFVSEVYSAVLQGDSLVTVGYGRSNEQESLDFLSIRITADGNLDETYGTGGFVRVDADGYNDNGRNMTALPNGEILLVGGGRYSSDNADGMMALLDANGTLDVDFGFEGSELLEFGGSNDFLWGAAVSPNGDKAVAVGIKGISGSDVGNDDAAVVFLSL